MQEHPQPPLNLRKRVLRTLRLGKPRRPLPLRFVAPRVQRQIRKDLTVTAAYVGSLAHHLPFAVDINYPSFNSTATTANVNARRPIDTACTKVVPPVRLVPAFARTVAEMERPSPGDAKRWNDTDLRLAAAAVAAQLKTEKLVFLSDMPGILMDRKDPASLLPHLDAARCRDLISRGVIDEGMIPKVEACLDSLRAGVRKTHMIDGRQRHALLLEIYTHQGVGTEIVLGA